MIPMFKICFLLFQGLLSLLLAYLVYRKAPTYRVNRLFALTFVSWSIFYGVESIWQAIANPNDLVLANFLRDLSLTGALIAAVGIFLAIYYLYYNYLPTKIGVGALLLLLVGVTLGNYFDYVYYNNLEGMWYVSTDISTQFFSYAIITIFTFSSFFLLILFRFKIEDKLILRKISFLLFGVSLTVISLVYYLVGIDFTVFLFPELWEILEFDLPELLLLISEISIFWAMK